MVEEDKDAVLERYVTIKNRLGLHARAAALFRECASRFQSEISVVKDYMKANAKSLLGLIALGAAQGTRLKIEAKGTDAKVALDALERLVNSMFEERE